MLRKLAPRLPQAVSNPRATIDQAIAGAPCQGTVILGEVGDAT